MSMVLTKASELLPCGSSTMKITHDLLMMKLVIMMIKVNIPVMTGTQMIKIIK